MAIDVKDVEKILLSLGIHNEGNVDMNLANSIVRTMGAHGQQEATEEFVRKYLIDGGTAIPEYAEPPHDSGDEEDPDHVIDEDEDEDDLKTKDK